ncbi:MAG: PilZ domain-containing protein, partial [Bdellovibrio sp.]
MTTQVFITGMHQIPPQLKKDRRLQCHVIDNPYNLRDQLDAHSGEKIIIAFLPFLEMRHFDIYNYLQKKHRDVKTFFVIDELSSAMKIRLKSREDFVVLWKTEVHNLNRDIHAHLDGKKLELRQDKRENHDNRALVSPSLLP